MNFSQSKLRRHYIVFCNFLTELVKETFFRLFCCHFFLLFFFPVFISSVPSKVVIIVIRFVLSGLNIFCALLRAHFNSCLTARTKMSLSWAQNIFMLAHKNSVVLLQLLLLFEASGSVGHRNNDASFMYLPKHT